MSDEELKQQILANLTAGSQAGKKASDPNSWTLVYRTPGDASSGAIGLWDPVNNEMHTLPATSTTTTTTKNFSGTQWITDQDSKTQRLWGFDPADNQFKLVPGSPPQAVPARANTHANIEDKNTGITYIWDDAKPGGPGYVPAAGVPGEAKPKEGDTRQVIQSGRQTTQTYRGGEWVTTGIGDVATPGAPKEGDTRQTIQNGRTTTQTYRGGDWVTTSIGDVATPGAAKEGDTRQVVQSGRNTTQTYRGGEWVTTAIGDVATPGAAKEGDTRPNVQSGYQVQEVYRGGQWVVDPSVPPKRFTPQTPTTLTASSDQPSIVRTDEQGNVVTVANPNYQPKDVAQRVQQLQQQAQAKRDDLQRQYQAGVLTQDERDQQWQQWWQTTVEPQRSALEQAQRQQQFPLELQAQQEARAQRQEQASYEQQRQTAARAAATDAVARVQATLPYRVGPSFGPEFSQALKTLSGGGGQVSFSPDAFTYQMPDLNTVAEQATAKALASISPYAALKAGVAAPQLPPTLDIASMLNQTSYAFPSTGGLPAAPSPLAAPPPGLLPAGVAGTVADPRFAGALPIYTGPS